MKLKVFIFLSFLCFNITCQKNLEWLDKDKNESVWNELLGSWEFNNKTISPNLSKNGANLQYVLIRSGMEADTRWSEISVDFQINADIAQYSVGFVLNTKDSCDFGIISINRLSNLSSLKLGLWKYGKYRPWLNINLKKDIQTKKKYRLSIYPTTKKEEWRPWTITLTEDGSNEILLEQAIQNDIPMFGRGIVGLYSKESQVTFQNFNITQSSTIKQNLRLAPLFSDGMVIQRNKVVPVWGLAAPGKNVQLEFNNQSFNTKSGISGHWRINLSPMEASLSLKMKVVSGRDSIFINNVAIGEVWLASGQSNMNMKVWQSDMSTRSKELAPDIGLRMFLQPQWASNEPVFDSGGEWENAESGNVDVWSAVAYSFALQLREKLKVPIGIIGSYWGGTAAESWLPREELGADPITKPILDQFYSAQEALELGQQIRNIRPWNVPDQRHAPGYLFNGMIYPHIPYAINGVIWYQGESNAKRAKQYETLFPMLIRSWRKEWDLPEMNFLFVQLPGYDGKQSGSNIESAWPQLRDAQRLTLQKVDNTGMAVTIDLGEVTNIHPYKKRELGERLARLALHDIYGMEDIVRSGPLYESVTFNDKSAIVSFSDCAKSLQIHESNILQGFEIAGSNQQFFPALAEINSNGKSVHVWSDKINKPVAVRYAWKNFPDKANLINSSGLPASPFRTDEWPLPTDKNR